MSPDHKDELIRKNLNFYSVNELDVLKATESSVDTALTNLSFGSRKSVHIGAGDALGRVHIWKIGQSLTSSITNEINILETISQVVE